MGLGFRDSTSMAANLPSLLGGLVTATGSSFKSCQGAIDERETAPHGRGHVSRNACLQRRRRRRTHKNTNNNTSNLLSSTQPLPAATGVKRGKMEHEAHPCVQPLGATKGSTFV